MLAVALVLIGQGKMMFYLGIGSWIADARAVRTPRPGDRA